LTLLHVTAFSAVLFNYLYFDRVVQNGKVLNYSVFYTTAIPLFYRCLWLPQLSQDILADAGLPCDGEAMHKVTN